MTRLVALWMGVVAACSSQPSGPRSLVSIDEVPAFEDSNPDPHILEVDLHASETMVEMVPGYQTKVMAYNERIPGPLLHARVGDRVIVHFENDLSEPTTIHWHGLRISSDMDGNPMIQPPIPPGGTFTYDFVLPEAGTFWFHPHTNTIEQIERGLYGAILVEERDPPKFTAEHLFVIDDIRLDSANQIAPFERSGHDVMMGRLGNTLLVNGSSEPATGTPPLLGIERWHLVNAATARVFELSVDGASWRVIGSDGGRIPEPYTTDRLVIAPGQRYDLEVTYDHDVPMVQLLAHDTNAYGQEVTLPIVQYTPTGTANDDLPVYSRVELPAMPASPIAKDIKLGANDTGFTINGYNGDKVPVEHFDQGVPVVFTITNEIGPYHPFHLHGQFFQILTRNGQPANEPGFKDTVLLDAFESVQIMTYFENPGMWMYHCHIPEHAENGMMAMLMVMAPMP